MGNSNNNGKIGFLDHNEREIESIHMQRTQHGEWMTTNQVLIATNANKYIVHAMNRRSERIRENLKLQNYKLQAEKDAVNMSQQQTTSWNGLPAAVLDQVIKNSTNPTFVTSIEDQEAANPTLATSNADQERATSNNDNNNNDNNNDDNGNPEISTNNETVPPPTKYSQKMKDLELWHQRLGHCGTTTMNETRKCTEGFPALPTTNPFFKCPFCEKAKMMKRGGKRKDEDTFIPGQAYHMDLSFVSGPSNLEDVSAGAD